MHGGTGGGGFVPNANTNGGGGGGSTTTTTGSELNSLVNRAGRSATMDALGGTQGLGTFTFKEPPQVYGLPKSYSVSADGTPSYLTPTQMGRQELYVEVPFQAVFGLQRNVRSISQAFALSAAEMDINETPIEILTEEERTARKSRASMFIMDELEFDASVVTIPLVFAIVVAALSQFLVG